MLNLLLTISVFFLSRITKLLTHLRYDSFTDENKLSDNDQNLYAMEYKKQKKKRKKNHLLIFEGWRCSKSNCFISELLKKKIIRGSNCYTRLGPWSFINNILPITDLIEMHNILIYKNNSYGNIKLLYIVNTCLHFFYSSDLSESHN
jgi:hypothetical protein